MAPLRFTSPLKKVTDAVVKELLENRAQINQADIIQALKDTIQHFEQAMQPATENTHRLLEGIIQPPQRSSNLTSLKTDQPESDIAPDYKKS